MSLHRLFLSFDVGDPWQLFGPEDAMQIQYEELQAAMSAVDGTGAKTVELHGCMDTYDRGPVSFTVRTESLRAVQLTRMAYA
jgi:hypothetical protein